MKKLFILLVLLCAGFSAALAQDLITTKSGEDVKAKVLEVGVSAVKYVKSSNPDGPVYTLPCEDILMIRYANGEKDVFVEKYEPRPDVYDNLRYRDYRHQYNPREYMQQPGDPYDPFASALVSYFIPGLGQCICGEWGRGLGFFFGTEVGFALSLGALASAASNNYDYYYSGGQGRYHQDEGQFLAGLTMLAGTCALYIWNIADARRVARVKNMYYQDKYGRNSELKLHIDPFVGLSPAAATPGTNLAGGLSLKLEF